MLSIEFTFGSRTYSLDIKRGQNHNRNGDTTHNRNAECAQRPTLFTARLSHWPRSRSPLFDWVGLDNKRGCDPWRGIQGESLASNKVEVFGEDT